MLLSVTRSLTCWKYQNNHVNVDVWSTPEDYQQLSRNTELNYLKTADVHYFIGVAPVQFDIFPLECVNKVYRRIACPLYSLFSSLSVKINWNLLIPCVRFEWYRDFEKIKTKSSNANMFVIRLKRSENETFNANCVQLTNGNIWQCPMHCLFCYPSFFLFWILTRMREWETNGCFVIKIVIHRTRLPFSLTQIIRCNQSHKFSN